MNYQNGMIDLETLKAKEVSRDILTSLLSNDANHIYDNRINQTSENKIRYLQCVFEEGDREEKLKWITTRFNSLVNYFKGTWGPFAELDLMGLSDNNKKRSLFFIWLVLKDEFEHITKEDLNKLPES